MLAILFSWNASTTSEVLTSAGSIIEDFVPFLQMFATIAIILIVVGAIISYLKK